MPGGNKTGKQGKRKTVPNAAHRRVGIPTSSPTTSRTPVNLPPQYNFTPAPNVTPTPPPIAVNIHPSTSTPNVRSFPPPQELFPPQERLPPQSAPLGEAFPSPPQAHSQPSSHGNNFEEEDESPVLTDLQEDTMRALNALLMVPDRHQFTTVLSPTQTPDTSWFTRDRGSKLVRAVTKVFTNKFDGPFYSWTCVPRDRQERYFLEFAKTHTWDPLITGTVKGYFDAICLRRMKDMVSSVRVSRIRPTWIGETLWTQMTAYWDTDEAKERSVTYSNARMSDRGGLGPHIHLSGPKSYQEIQQEMEDELGRPVSIGEVFKRTHTKPDGTYVDMKAEKIVQRYEQTVQEKLNEIQCRRSETSEVSDGASRPRELTTDEYTALFLQSTYKDSRGTPYGVGSLKQSFRNGKRKQPGDTSSFVSLQEQLIEAQKKIEEQAAYNARRDSEDASRLAVREAEIAAREAEHARQVAQQKDKIDHLSLVEKYLRQTDPRFIAFLSAQTTPASTLPDPR